MCLFSKICLFGGFLLDEARDKSGAWRIKDISDCGLGSNGNGIELISDSEEEFVLYVWTYKKMFAVVGQKED